MLTTKTLTQDDLAEAVKVYLRLMKYEVKGEVSFECKPEPDDPTGCSDTFTASAQVDEIPRKKRAAK